MHLKQATITPHGRLDTDRYERLNQNRDLFLVTFESDDVLDDLPMPAPLAEEVSAGQPAQHLVSFGLIERRELIRLRNLIDTSLAVA